MDDGSHVVGETKITASERRIVELKMVPADPEPMPQTLQAIADADLITIGPGSLFTSLIPNLLVRGIPEAIAASRAVKVFICNLMTEANESLHMSASDHVKAIYAHGGHGLFHYALVNREPVSAGHERALRGRARPGRWKRDIPRAGLKKLGVQCIAGNFILGKVNWPATPQTVSARELLRLAKFTRPRICPDFAPQALR